MDVLGLRRDLGNGNRGMCRREVLGKPAFPFPELHPLRELRCLLSLPLAEPGTQGAFAFGRRLVAWDGTGVDAAAIPANAREFGMRTSQGGNPQITLLALTECGTHAIIDAASGAVTKASELKLARRLLHALGPWMLLLADRNFAGWELWGQVAATGADMA